MSDHSPLVNSLLRLRRQMKAFRELRSRRSFRARSGTYTIGIKHPNWQFLGAVTISLIIVGFLFLDNASGVWRKTVSPETYAFFRAFTDLGKSEFTLVPSGLLVLSLSLLPWDRVSQSIKGSLVQFQLASLYVFVAIAGSGLTNNLLKMAVGRARPRHFDELGAVHFDPPGLSSGFQSFPSGHSATAGALAIILIFFLPRLKWTWLFLTGWIAASRIVVGAHYPSDAIAGFAYGALFAWLLGLWFVRRRLLFRASGGLIRLPKTHGLSLSKLYKALHIMRQKA